MATSFEESEKEVQIDHLRTNTYHLVWRNFFKSTLAHAKMRHVSPITPLLGMIYHPFGKTLYNLLA